MDLREIKEFLRDAGIYIITIAVLAFILVFVVSFQPIAGNSMYPNLEEGNVVVVSKFSYNFIKPKRNDIVVAKVNGKLYVKRVIGLPGEDIKYLKNVLYINDQPYKEDFLGEGIETSGFTLDDICKEGECPDGKIPEGKYLLMGDNRPESEDSRTSTFGLVEKGNIKGRVLFRVWPLSSFGKIDKN